MANRGVPAEYRGVFLHIEKWRGNVAATVSLHRSPHPEVKGKHRTVLAGAIQIWKWRVKMDRTVIATSRMG